MSVQFDPHDPALVTDGIPFDVLARLRAERPISRTPSGSWYLSRSADVEAALKDVDTFRAELGPITGIPGGVVTIPEEEHYLSEIPEPRHTAIRRIFNAALATNRVREIEPAIIGECHRLLDVLIAQGDVADLHGGYAALIPAHAMTLILGLDAADAPRLAGWSTDGTIMTRPSTPGVAAGGPATNEWFRPRLAAERARAQPANPVFAALISTEVEGRRLTDAEILTQLHFMIQAGVHTTRGLVTHLVNRLVQDPSMFRALQGDRALVPRFLEESLRHDPPVQRTTRLCTRDAVVGDVVIREGEWVEMGIASANRDDAVYEDPERFELGRADPRRHLAFGAGSHVCPGASLARVEGLAAVNVLLDRLAELRTVPGATYPPLPGNLGHLPVPAVLVTR